MVDLGGARCNPAAMSLARDATARGPRGREGYNGARECAMALGVVLVILGGIFLLESLGLVEMGVAQLWPLALIGLGLVIIIERTRRWRRTRPPG
jgi:hypothetical protein